MAIEQAKASESATLYEKTRRNPSILLSRPEVDALFGISERWLELAATRGDGPPMIKISRRMVRYRACDVESWIASRAVSSTSEDI